MTKLHSSVVDVGLTESRDRTPETTCRLVAHSQLTDFRFYDDVIAQIVGRRDGVGSEQVIWSDDRIVSINDRQAWTSNQPEWLIVHLHSQRMLAINVTAKFCKVDLEANY